MVGGQGAGDTGPPLDTEHAMFYREPRGAGGGGGGRDGPKSGLVPGAGKVCPTRALQCLTEAAVEGSEVSALLAMTAC
jgi:hypothetical protein